jgi:hypothetical protein
MEQKSGDNRFDRPVGAVVIGGLIGAIAAFVSHSNPGMLEETLIQNLSPLAIGTGTGILTAVGALIQGGVAMDLGHKLNNSNFNKHS